MKSTPLQKTELSSRSSDCIISADSKRIVINKSQLNKRQLAALKQLGYALSQSAQQPVMVEKDDQLHFDSFIFTFDNGMIDIQNMVKDTLKCNPPVLEHQLGAPINAQEVINRAVNYATFLLTIEDAVVNCLSSYETISAAKDEFNRTIDLLTNLHENANYFQKRIGRVATFLPKNQPLYAFACFVLIPSLMANNVTMRIPSAMTLLLPDLLSLINYSQYFPNIEVSTEKRQVFVDRVSKNTDAVIFTGTMENADSLVNQFPIDTLFISNGAGHNPLIVTQQANIKEAVEAAIEIQFHNQGQDCAAPNAVLVHSTILDTFVQELIQELSKIKIGKYQEREVTIGPLTDLKGIDSIVELVVKNAHRIIYGGKIDLKTGLVDPIVLLANEDETDEISPYSELFGPVMKIISYSSDESLMKYFNDARYAHNAMYITIYGDLPIPLNQKVHKGWLLHDESTIIHNTHLHVDGVERGIFEYGGYGLGASSLRYANFTIGTPTLPQRDIYEYLVRPSAQNELPYEGRIPHHYKNIINSPIMPVENNRITSRELSEAPNWSNLVAGKVIDRFPDEEVYTVAAGISPSGVVHFGNLRDVMTSLAVAKSLKERGKNVRFIFSWDDFDRFRNVPKGLAYHLNLSIDSKIFTYSKKPELLTQYEGFPLHDLPVAVVNEAIKAYDAWFSHEYSAYDGCSLSSIPDPKGELGSYAERFESEFQNAMQQMDIDLQYIRQSEQYQLGTYAEKITLALQKREQIARILYSFMSDKAKTTKNLTEANYVSTYYPISVYSTFTGKDNTEILDYNGAYELTYRCLDTNKLETINIKTAKNIKLQWKIDWAMRWDHEQVHFEPGGKDHATPSGSYDTSSIIAKEVFGRSAPVFVGYDFIGLSGLDGKMSSSAGNAVSPNQLLKIYTPDLLRWIYERTTPSKPFSLAFDSEVFRLYSEFDAKHDVEGVVQFRQLVGFGQTVDWDLDRLCRLLDLTNTKYDRVLVAERLPKAKAWAETYNRTALISLNEKANTSYFATLTNDRLKNIQALVSYLKDCNTDDIEGITSQLYMIPKRDLQDFENGEITQEDKKRQQQFFKDVYQLLFSKNKGPRLATYIWALGKAPVITLLDL